MRLFRTSFFLALWMALLFSVTVEARPTEPLSGTWRIDGKHRAKGPYHGSVRFTPIASDLVKVERRIILPDGSLDTLKGTGLIQGDRLTVRFLQKRHVGVTGTLTGTGPSVKKREVLASYRFQTPDRLEGWYFSKTDSRDTGTERILRSGRTSEVELLVDGSEYFPRLYKALAQAKHSIDFEVFIFRNDATGRKVADLLIRKARQGVKVRLLLDAIGAKSDAKKFAKEIRAAGGKVVFYNKILGGIGRSLKGGLRKIGNFFGKLFGFGKPRPREERGVTHRDHRKLTVIDGQIVFCGGMNIGSEYLNEYHDLHSIARGPVVFDVLREFRERWRISTGKSVPMRIPSFDSRLQGLVNGLAAPTRVTTTLPGIKDEIRQDYLHWIRKARREILIENPYFLDDAIINALKRASGRGIPVHVLIPDPKTDKQDIVGKAFDFIQNEVVRAGVNIYKYPGLFLHGKVATIDGTWSTIGSANLDNMSLSRNLELNFSIIDPDFSLYMKKRIFNPDLARSPKQGTRKLGFWRKVKGGFWHLFRGWI